MNLRAPGEHAGSVHGDPVQAFRQAEVLERLGRVAEAEAIYRELVQSYPNHPDVLHSLALLVRVRGNTEEAEALLRRAVAAAPERPDLHNTLGVVLSERGKPAEAEACHRQAIALRPGYVEAHFNLGLTLEDLGRRDEALAAYRKAIAQQPDYARAHTRIGAMLNAQGAQEDALVHFDQAVAAAPDSFDAQYYRGWALSDLRRHDEALAALSRANALKPDSFEATLATANALRNAGRNDEALTAYWKLMEMRLERLETHSDLNQLAWTAGREDLFLRSFDYARSRLGDNPDLMYLEAAFRVRREDYASAEQLLRRARELAPERGDIAGMLARALAGQGKHEESYPFFSLAINAEPGSTRHHPDFGYTLLRDSQADEALRVFEHGRAIAPNDQLILSGLALAYRAAGDSRYFELMDFSKYVRVYELSAPPGFADSAAFNRALAQELDVLHTVKVEPIDQSLRGGTQTTGRLFGEPSRLIGMIRDRIALAVEDYIAHLPDGVRHPMEARKGGGFEFTGSWSCRLNAGGYHRNHVHPQGWISSAYYARLPGALDDEEARHGWLKFGESHLALGDDDRPERFIKPAVGRLVLFPSFYWHGTVPFPDGGDRLTIAFDAIPKPQSLRFV